MPARYYICVPLAQEGPGQGVMEKVTGLFIEP